MHGIEGFIAFVIAVTAGMAFILMLMADDDSE
jgi:hypothetical protein